MTNEIIHYREVEFLIWKAFARELKRAKEPELQEKIFDELIANPIRGAQLKGGLRKARVGSKLQGTGKRGGYRYVYYLKTRNSIYLLALLDKTKADSFTKEFTDALVQIARSI